MQNNSFAGLLPQKRSLGYALGQAGTIVGALDIAAALTHYALATGKNPVAVFPFVASGVFGSAAFAGNPAMVGWGALFHFLIAFAVVATFFWLYPRLPMLRRNVVAVGCAYGVAVWVVMMLVVPLSNVPPQPLRASSVVVGLLVHMLCIGLPTAGLARRYYARPAPAMLRQP